MLASCLKMKVANLGETNSYDVKMVQSTKPNQHGKLYFFKDRIYLRKSQPIKHYDVWFNNGQMQKLVLDDTELFNELQQIVAAVNKGKKGKEVMDFKLVPGRLYIKLSQTIHKLPLHHELLYTIAVSGVFQQSSTKKAFLQMEVTEVINQSLYSLLRDPLLKILNRPCGKL